MICWEKWGNPKDVCIGGLFHRIYGTQYYTVQSTNLADRRRIADTIGPRPEQLAFLFCTTDRMSFFMEGNQASPMLVDATTKKSVLISRATLRALTEIEVANRLPIPARCRVHGSHRLYETHAQDRRSPHDKKSQRRTCASAGTIRLNEAL
jgi:hypothetical protein